MRISRLCAVLLLSGTALVSTHHNARADGFDRPNKFYWPSRLDLNPLRFNNPENVPYGANYSKEYAKKFATLNLEEVRADIKKVMSTSQDWWPADFGNYGPFFIRMA